MVDNHTQVAIVGAGPTGATLALLLVKQGIQVKLVEASRHFQRLFRGEGLMPSGLAALEQMDLLELVWDLPHQAIDAWSVLLNNRSLFRVDEPIERGGMPCMTVSQPHLLNAIIDRAKNHPNFEFIPGEAVKDLLRHEGRISGVKLAGNRQITADLVIAADGRNSTMRNKAGINLIQSHHSIDLLWFKLDSGKLRSRKNVFYSIVKGKDAFGLFRGSSGQFHLGWGLHPDDTYNWQEVDWLEKLTATAPPWLAQHLQTHQASLTKPMLLSVVVGRCDRWSVPGLLLLGDAVHPMSPIRAQGINMAFRDAIVTANHLIPLLNQSKTNCDRLDAVLPLIQREREPEIIRVQQLQAQEMAQAELLHNYGFLRWSASIFAPIISPGIRASWLRRQQQLRQGVTNVSFNHK